MGSHMTAVKSTTHNTQHRTCRHRWKHCRTPAQAIHCCCRTRLTTREDNIQPQSQLRHSKGERMATTEKKEKKRKMALPFSSLLWCIRRFGAKCQPATSALSSLVITRQTQQQQQQCHSTVKDKPTESPPTSFPLFNDFVLFLTGN